MNISALKSGISRGSARLTSASQKTLGGLKHRLGLRLLAKCERRERRVREEVASILKDRARAFALMGGRGR